MQFDWKSARSFAWLPAFGLCWVGWRGITPLEPGWNPDQFIIVGAPHLLLIAVAGWAGRVGWGATLFALLGCGLAAYLPWTEQASRQTKGFEWRFNNAMDSAMFCCAGYGVLFMTTFAVFGAWVCEMEHVPRKRDGSIEPGTESQETKA